MKDWRLLVVLALLLALGMLVFGAIIGHDQGVKDARLRVC